MEWIESRKEEAGDEGAGGRKESYFTLIIIFMLVQLIITFAFHFLFLLYFLPFIFRSSLRSLFMESKTKRNLWRNKEVNLRLNVRTSEREREFQGNLELETKSWNENWILEKCIDLYVWVEVIHVFPLLGKDQESSDINVLKLLMLMSIDQKARRKLWGMEKCDENEEKRQFDCGMENGGE